MQVATEDRKKSFEGEGWVGFWLLAITVGLFWFGFSGNNVECHGRQAVAIEKTAWNTAEKLFPQSDPRVVLDEVGKLNRWKSFPLLQSGQLVDFPISCTSR